MSVETRPEAACFATIDECEAVEHVVVRPAPPFALQDDSLCSRCGRQILKVVSYRSYPVTTPTHAAVYNLFNPGSHLVGAGHYRSLRKSAFVQWAEPVA